MSVDTFEWARGRLEHLSRSPDLKAASASLPEGVYTTLRTYGGRRILRLAQHAARLAESSALKGNPAPFALDTLRAAVSAALTRPATPSPACGSPLPHPGC